MSSHYPDRGGKRPSPPGSSENQQLKYLLPNDTAPVVTANIGKCRNMSLILARYIPEQAIENSSVPDERNAKWRDKWLKDQCKLFGVTEKQLRDLIDATLVRWQAMVARAEQFSLVSQGRLIIGLGGESVLETSLTLQFVTGLPIIPGSALKGLCRHYALLTIGAKLGITGLGAAELRNRQDKKDKTPTPLQELDEALAAMQWPTELVYTLEEKQCLQEAELFRAIFGSTEYGGVCLFYDAVVAALPSSGNLFMPDVMTPHFPDYYTSNGATPPADNQNPNPIQFLTVAAGTEFAFAIGLRRQFGNQSESAQTAANWLKAALHEMGIGAKTAAGYGVFERGR